MPRARGQRVTIVNDKRVTTATALTRLGLGWYLGSATDPYLLSRTRGRYKAAQAHFMMSRAV